MKKQFLTGSLIASAVTIASFVQASPAKALSFSYDFNCVMSGTLNGQSYSGGNGCTDVSPTSFGKLTLSDTGVANQVQVAVDLTGTQNKILEMSLNYLGTATNFQINTSTITLDPNKVKSDGYPGFFDLVIPKNGNLGATDTFTALITATGLTASQLNTTDTLGRVFSGLHIGNYGTSPGTTGGNSIWVGAKSAAIPIPTPAILPGLIGMGVAAIRKKKQVDGETQDA